MMKSIPLILAAAGVFTISCQKEESYLEKRQRERTERKAAEETQKAKAVEQEIGVKEGSSEEKISTLVVMSLAATHQQSRLKLHSARSDLRKIKAKARAGMLTDALPAGYTEIVQESEALWKDSKGRDALKDLLPRLKDEKAIAMIQGTLQIDEHLIRSDEYSIEIDRLSESPEEQRDSMKMLELSRKWAQEMYAIAEVGEGQKRLLSGAAKKSTQ